MEIGKIAELSELKVPLISLGDDEELGSSGDGASAAAAASSRHGKHTLGLGALVFLIYYNIGVPFGDEEAVKAAGPFLVNVGFFVILPIMWQLPICLITAELTTTFQDHRGSIAWVSEAFGAQWGFIDAVWSLATSFLDTALFPLIIADFLDLTGASRWLFVYSSIAGLTWAVYRGSGVVASAEGVVFIATMIPLMLMVMLGLAQMDWGLVTTPPDMSTVDWKLYIQIMFWTSTYWQKVASVGPDVKNCPKTFPRAILCAAGMQILINGIIHCVAAGATDPAEYAEWAPGYLRVAADAIAGGEWLGTWITIMSAVANSGSFLSEMSVTSQTLVGMSERGLLPKRMMEESRHGTHPWALGVIVVLVALSQPLDFKELVIVCNFLYTFQTGLELLAFFRLRTSLPGLRRPFQVPGGRAGALLAFSLPMITLAAVITTVSASAAGVGALISVGTIVAARFVFRPRHRRRGVQTFEYDEIRSARDSGSGNLSASGTSLREDGSTMHAASLTWEWKMPPFLSAYDWRPGHRAEERRGQGDDVASGESQTSRSSGIDSGDDEPAPPGPSQST